MIAVSRATGHSYFRALLFIVGSELARALKYRASKLTDLRNTEFLGMPSMVEQSLKIHVGGQHSAYRAICSAQRYRHRKAEIACGL
jgi:hypothetical protein